LTQPDSSAKKDNNIEIKNRKLNEQNTLIY